MGDICNTWDKDGWLFTTHSLTTSNVLAHIYLFFQFKTVFKASKNASNREKFGKNILGGGCAGTLSLCFVQSIDYTRTRLATDAKCASGKRQFNGIIDVYVKTVKSDGIKGLYRGFLTSSVCIFIYRGLYFGLYDSLKPILLKENPLWVHTFLLGWAVTITSGLVRNIPNVPSILSQIWVHKRVRVPIPYSFMN